MMEPFERDRIAREADLQPVDSGDSKPLIVMICAALAATAMVLGIMWVNTNRHDGASHDAVAEQTQR
jgi:hypothetical protein